MKSPGLKLLNRATELANSMSDIPDRADAFLGLFAMIITRTLKTSPDDQAELVEMVGRLMKR